MPQNIGEENEIFLKTFLLMMYSNGKPLEGEHGIGLITSLRFSPEGELPKWNPKYEEYLKNRDYIKLKKIFPKSTTNSKADLEINGIKYSVKTSLGARPAIVNHTSRRGFLRIFKSLELDISPLDNIIDEYWKRRIKGIIKEDVSNQDVNSPFKDHKDYLKPIVEYFLFTGTGSKDSSFPADKMFIFDQPENMNSYKILNKSQAVDKIWDKLVFSVRSKKGMPFREDSSGKKYSTYILPDHDDMAPWVRFYPEGTDFPKGALHIRYE